MPTPKGLWRNAPSAPLWRAARSGFDGTWKTSEGIRLGNRSRALGLVVALLFGVLWVPIGAGLSPTPAAASFPGRDGFIYATGGHSLYRIDPATGERTDIGFGAHPSVSADGERLAYLQWGYGIWVMDVDGTNKELVLGPDWRQPSWSPDGTRLAVIGPPPGAWESRTQKNAIYTYDLVSKQTELVTDLSPDLDTVPPNRKENYPDYENTSWSPSGNNISFQVLPSTCSYCTTVGTVPAQGGAPFFFPITHAPGGSQRMTGGDWDPNAADRILYSRWDREPGLESPYVQSIYSASVDGTNTQLHSQKAYPYNDPQGGSMSEAPIWSPSGDQFLVSFLEKNEDENYYGPELWTATASGEKVKQLTSLTDPTDPYLSEYVWAPAPGEGLEVTLEARGPDGTSLDRIISLAQTVTVELTIENGTEETLDTFTFTGNKPLVVDPRSKGAVKTLSGPTPAVPPDLSLDAGEKATFLYEVQPTKNGLTALHSKVTALNESAGPEQDGHSLKFQIQDGAKITKELAQYLRLQAMDKLWQETFGEWHRAMERRGKRVAAELSEIFTPAERKKWFGSANGIPLSPNDFALAALRGTSAHMIAALMPKNDFKGHTVESLSREYDETFREQVGKGVGKYVDGYKELAGSVKKFAQDSWSESLLTAAYYMGSASPDERMQFEAMAMTMVDGSAADAKNIANIVKQEIPRWRENVMYLDEALRETDKQVSIQAGALKIKEAIDRENEFQRSALKLADSDPVAYQRMVAKHDAEIFNAGLVPIMDIFMGGAVMKGAGALKGVVVRGKGAGVIRSGEAAGVLDEGSNVVPGPTTAVEVADDIPVGPSNVTVAQVERGGAFFDDVDNATVVHSSDLGDIYEMKNLGGVPETTLEAKAKILKELEQEWAKKYPGREPLKLAEVLKPSSPYRKPGGVAKVELTGQKTGKPSMIDAGAPPDVLGEANVWRGPDPRELPGFDDLAKPRQKAAIKEWEEAEKRWAEWESPEPGSKTARLQQCIGQECTVPLDTSPNASGLQRFVTAHFEVTDVVHGQAEAKLIRVKKYDIEFRVNGETVNTKSVVNVPEGKPAVPQTPDADGVAMAKVVGKDAKGRDILKPLSRAEREFTMQRYIDKNIKARRKPAGAAGAVNDLAEHGVTLVMDDASAKAAGKLLSMYGVPFLPEGVGMAYLKRIAPFVTAKNATAAEVNKMYRQLVNTVRSEGGFGQHAIVVTTDSRYLGDVPFASW